MSERSDGPPTGGWPSLRPGWCASSVVITGPATAGGAVGTVNACSGEEIWPSLLRADRSSSLMSRVDIVVLGDVVIRGERANSVGNVAFLPPSSPCYGHCGNPGREISGPNLP